eukprot:Mrub_05384.p1 GENE.Mrub_05384~~Mrub_05384.p1  ORF type:complete len:349 (+),score=94.26 Mrub_05384:107-1048(+)
MKQISGSSSIVLDTPLASTPMGSHTPYGAHTPMGNNSFVNPMADQKRHQQSIEMNRFLSQVSNNNSNYVDINNNNNYAYNQYSNQYNNNNQYNSNNQYNDQYNHPNSSNPNSKLKIMKSDVDHIQMQINQLEQENYNSYNNKSNSKTNSIKKDKTSKSTTLDVNTSNKNNGYLNKHIKKDEANYVPYSMKDYQNIKGKDNKLAGSLGPNIGSDEWVDRKAKQLKMAEFGQQIKKINKNTVVTDADKYIKKEQEAKAEKKSKEQNVQKRLDYAKNVPKPKINKAQSNDDEIYKLEKELMDNDDYIRKLKKKYMN